ncbi:kinase-like domain-containing protein [Cokeromyces recurvatus]|uniref:kinase-like domain-containing protein n=1 Tax=Cokeromyces recurvatus TaxID=90255 RepID=UPI00221EE437|nr:kinase-like domain-containing protein [Cokeromyces recurvatus]KAI7901240.1 kinase-like domain-containing protein [Cokeromyces recurvatus]
MSHINDNDYLPSYEESICCPPKKDKLVENMTVHLLNTFRRINPCFEYNTSRNPKRILTKPSLACKNDGYDNEYSDYILYVNDWIGPIHDERRYLIIDLLGSGTFGQVVKCKDTETNELVGIKVIKNKPAYTKQSLLEVDVLEHLNNVSDPYDEHHILRLYDSFMFRNHLCLVFELLSVNLYELLKQNHFKGFSIYLVRLLAMQLLDTLSTTKKYNIIHCDLKPENILLKSLDDDEDNDSSIPEIKVIDFGSACYEFEQSYSYIQSRFYRSPEVLLGLTYTTAIDMWSFGCIVAELYLGLPLFPGSSEYNQLSRIIETVGHIPDYMIQNGKYSHRYYNRYKSKDPITGQVKVSYQLKDMTQYSEERNKVERESKRYFSTYVLDDLVLKYPHRLQQANCEDEIDQEMELRKQLLDFLKKVLQVDPLKRLTPDEAMKHPFITYSCFESVKDQEVTTGMSRNSSQDELLLSSFGKKNDEENDYMSSEDEMSSMLTHFRRKSIARSSLSVSPFSRKRFESLQKNSLLASPSMEEEEDHNEDVITSPNLSSTSNSLRLRNNRTKMQQ